MGFWGSSCRPFTGHRLSCPNFRRGFKRLSLPYTRRLKWCTHMHVLYIRICWGEGGGKEQDHFGKLLTQTFPFSFHCAFNNFHMWLFVTLGGGAWTEAGMMSRHIILEIPSFMSQFVCFNLTLEFHQNISWLNLWSNISCANFRLCRFLISYPPFLSDLCFGLWLFWL